MTEKTKYRGEIDGLRAIAVLAVVFFHLGMSSIQGGFVGVDVFFVLSGYLITGIIRRDLALSRYSYRDFFIRRVRRIAPALLFVTLCSLLASYFLLMPYDSY